MRYALIGAALLYGFAWAEGYTVASVANSFLMQAAGQNINTAGYSNPFEAIFAPINAALEKKR